MIWYIKRVKRDSTSELEVATLYTWKKVLNDYQA